MIKQRKRYLSLLLAVALLFGCLPTVATTQASYDAMPNYNLTQTLQAPIGAVGFESGFDNNPYAIIEIGVQFITPPYVALRLMQEAGHPYTRGLRTSYEAYAFAAHGAFFEQLNQLVGQESQAFEAFSSAPFQIIGEHHALFNGVFLQVPAYMVEQIAELPEVFAVIPNDRAVFGEESIYDDEHVRSLNFQPFNGPANEFMGQTSDMFNLNYIHNNLGFTGNGVRVAVIDTGIDYNHPRFVPYQNPATNRVRGHNVAGDHPSGFNASPNEVPSCPNFGHGTNVAGPIIAIAPGVELWVYRAINLNHVLTAINQARLANVDIINTSFSFPNAAIFSPFNNALNLAGHDGILVVGIAGNNGSNAFTMDFGGRKVLTAANGQSGSDDFISHNRGGIAASSSRGPEPVSFFIGPDITAPGTLVRTTSPGGGYEQVSGTSFAAPAIAGVAALLIEAFPSATPSEIKARMMNTARQLDYQADPVVRYENSVFNIGAGFVLPVYALRGGAFATVSNMLEWGGIGFTAWPTDYMEIITPSLNFGAVRGSTSAPLTVTIHNPGSGTWVPEARFNTHIRSHNGVSLNRISVNGQTHTFQMTFDDGVPSGRYEGNVVFTNTSQPDRAITIPFGAYLNFQPVLSITPTLNGGQHTFPSMEEGYTTVPAHTISFHNMNNVQSSGVRVVYLSGLDAGSFQFQTFNLVFSQPPFTSHIGQGQGVSIAPRLGLGVGVHRATVTVINQNASPNDIVHSFDISFEVTPFIDENAVNSWIELREAVNAAPENVPTTLRIGSSFNAPSGVRGNAITIPANRLITLVSNNTTEGAGNIRTLTQENLNQRHFIVNSSSSLTLCQNIKLCGNETRAGGIQVFGGGELIMNPGSVIQNVWHHGAVILSGNGTEDATRARLTMIGGVIQHNSSSNTGGVHANGNSLIVMENGSSISHNTGGTGGVFLDANSKLIMESGSEISHNTGSTAGGVEIAVNSTLIMKDGSEISNNTATFNTTLTWTGIAGGVLLTVSTSTFEMNGTATIRNNSQPNGNPRHAAGGVVMRNGAFTMYNGNITDNKANSGYGAGGIQLSDGFFTMHNGNISNNSNNGVAMGDLVMGGFNSRFTMHDGVISNNTGSGARIRLGTMIMNSGSISDNTGGGISLNTNVATFTMNNGTISGNRSTGIVGAGVNVGQGTFTMSGGVISYNTSDPYPSHSRSGGGVSIDGGVFNMTHDDARIENNRNLGSGPDSGGGGLRIISGTANITAGIITGNSAIRGGAIMIEGGMGTLNMDGGSIINNIVTENGGGIFLGNNGAVNINAGAITGNVAVRGGGVFIRSSIWDLPGRLNITGGSITNNDAAYNGGGIYTTFANHALIVPTNSFGDLNIGPDVVFFGNTAGNGWSAPPDNRLPHIATTTASIWDYILNNYDINYTGRLGQEPSISN